MRLLSTRTMLMRLLSKITMANEDAKHKYSQMRLLRTRTLTNEVAKHNNNANEAAK